MLQGSPDIPMIKVFSLRGRCSEEVSLSTTTTAPGGEHEYYEKGVSHMSILESVGNEPYVDEAFNYLTTD